MIVIYTKFYDCATCLLGVFYNFFLLQNSLMWTVKTLYSVLDVTASFFFVFIPSSARLTYMRIYFYPLYALVFSTLISSNTDDMHYTSPLLTLAKSFL